MFDYNPPFQHEFYDNILSSKIVRDTVAVDSELDSDDEDHADVDEDDL